MVSCWRDRGLVCVMTCGQWNQGALSFRASTRYFVERVLSLRLNRRRHKGSGGAMALEGCWGGPRWDEVLLLMQQVPSDDFLESLYQMRIRGSDQFKTVLTLYKQEIGQHNPQPNYQKLRTTVKRCMDRKITARNFEARKKKLKQEYKLEVKGNLSALKESKENVVNGKRKDSAQKETLAVSATMKVNVEKTRNRPLLLQSRCLKATGQVL